MTAKSNSLGTIIGSAIASCAIAGCALTSNPSQTPTRTQNLVPADTVASSPEPQKTVLADNLEHPWSMAWLPDGAILITERPGRLRILRDGVLDPTPIPGVPEVFAVGQGGLMEVSLHPRFAETGWIYLTYASGSQDGNRTQVARAKFDGNALSEFEVIFQVSQAKPGSQHFGSRIVWLPDETMLVAIGDGGNPPVSIEGELIRTQAQNLDSHLGKIVRLNDDGSVPSDNPFVSTPDADPTVWSYGHRNIQGLAVDSQTGRIWATEHGARGGDELNLLQRGENYGWPVVTYSREYTGGIISEEQSRPGMVDPKQVWTPAIAPSGLAVYTSDRRPEWTGDLFAGGLVSQDLRHIELNAAGAVAGERAIAIGQRVRDVRQGPDGALYVLTDEPNGQLIRLE